MTRVQIDLNKDGKVGLTLVISMALHHVPSILKTLRLLPSALASHLHHG
jgi:hypothetical protein